MPAASMTFVLTIAWSHLRSRRQDVGISLIGIISVVVVFVAAIGYLTLPGMLTALLGAGCI